MRKCVIFFLKQQEKYLSLFSSSGPVDSCKWNRELRYETYILKAFTYLEKSLLYANFLLSDHVTYVRTCSIYCSINA